MLRRGLSAGFAVMLLLGSAPAEETPPPPPAAEAAPASPPEAEAPPPMSPEEKAKAAAEALTIKPTDIGIGDPAAKVKIIEYASSGCPHCAHFALVDLPQLKTAFIDKGQVYYVLRDFPLDNVAAGASLIARCLPADKFYPFMDTLFSQQEVWHSPSTADPLAELKKLAEPQGMDGAAVDACLKDQAVFERLKSGVEEAANALDVNSTPTIFIDGARADGDHSFLALAEKINAKLAQ